MEDTNKQQIKYCFNVLENLPGHVYWKDTNGIYLGCNKKFAHTMQLSSNLDIVGKSDYDLMDKDIADALFATDQEIIKTGNEKNIEETALDINGKMAIYLSHKRPLVDHYSQTIGIMGISFDITERKQLEQRLEHALKRAEKAELEKLEFLSSVTQAVTGQTVISNSFEDCVIDIREYLENIIALMPGHVYWLNDKNEYLGCNDEHAKAVGLSSRKDIIGKTNYDLPWHDSADILNANNNHVISSHEKYIIEETGQLANGKIATVLTQKVPLFNKNNKIIGILGVSLDITARKQMEKELQKEKEKAEIANKIKTEFMRNMQHDVRTPLCGILGMAEILSESEPDAQRKQNLNDVKQSSAELLEFCNAILDFSNVELGNMPILTNKFSIKNLIKQVTLLETPAAKHKGLNFSSKSNDNIPNIIIGDEARIYRILVNLVSNAIKFTEKGFVEIAVQLATTPNYQNNILKLMVRDSGIGIPKDKHALIYEKFTRLNPSNHGRYKGLGLGLRIVKQFVEDLEGEIELISAPGHGSTFTCTIPLQLSVVSEE